MVSPVVLEGKATVNVAGNATASSAPSNFVIQGNVADVANYAREGNNLIVEMKNGQVHTIRDFAAQGWDFNNLVFSQADTSTLVNLGKAVSAAGDGIVESLVATQSIGAGVSATTLLGILGATAGVTAAAVGTSNDDAEAPVIPLDPTDPIDPTDPSDPDDIDDTDPGDTEPPAAPAGFTLASNTNTSTVDGLTSDNQPTFNGKAEPYATVELFIDDVSIGSRTANGSGDWSFRHTTTLPDGTYIVTARATDTAGNVSPVSAPFTVVVDTVAAVPSNFTLASNTNTSTVDGLTSDNQPTFNGKAEPYATVELFINDISIGSRTANGSGDWSFHHTTTLPDGPYTVTATATDTAGNVSPVSASFTVTVDSATAAPFDISAADGLGVPIAGNSSEVRELVFSGKAEPHATVELFLNSTSIGTETTNEYGEWSRNYTGTTLAPNSYTLEVIATDIAGNTSSAGSYSFDVVPLTFGVTVTGDGSGTGIITFAFAEDVDDATFTEADIQVANGTLNAGSLTRVDARTYTATVTPDLGPANTNVAVTLASGTVSSTSGNLNIVGKNVTSLDNLFSLGSTLSGDITGWETSHATSAMLTFYSNATFNQDIGGWDTKKVTNMDSMFTLASAFNQDIGGWDTRAALYISNMFFGAWEFNQDISSWKTSSVILMQNMFKEAFSFDQDLGNWDISSLTGAGSMFADSGMSVANMDATLRGWAKLDTAAGETAIQNNVIWGISEYSDATARQYLIDHYNWSITGTLQANVWVGINGNDDTEDRSGFGMGQIMHGLGGDDTLTGGDGADWIVGGSGNDTLRGGAGADIFHYGFKDAGNDTIADFNEGDGDVLHLADLLIGYEQGTSLLSDFVWVDDLGGGNTLITIDHDGTGSDTTLVTIQLQNIPYSPTLLNDMITNGNLILA